MYRSSLDAHAYLLLLTENRGTVALFVETTAEEEQHAHDMHMIDIT